MIVDTPHFCDGTDTLSSALEFCPHLQILYTDPTPNAEYEIDFDLPDFSKVADEIGAAIKKSALGKLLNKE